MDISKITQALTEAVRQEAWRIYLERTWVKKPGTAEEDWFEAEKRVRPRRDYVQARAYRNYLSRVRRDEPGDALSDWLEAEAFESRPRLLGVA